MIGGDLWVGEWVGRLGLEEGGDVEGKCRREIQIIAIFLTLLQSERPKLFGFSECNRVKQGLTLFHIISLFLWNPSVQHFMTLCRINLYKNFLFHC